MDELADPTENYDEFDGIECDEPELDTDDYAAERSPEQERDDQREREDPRKEISKVRRNLFAVVSEC